MTARLGDWIQTFSGRQFWPLDPRADEIEIVDIAHALAHQCRYGGHIRRFYSVAEHCVLLARHVAPEHAFAALMHDAAEAYLIDLPRPIKLAMPSYRTAEAAIWLAICTRYGLEPELPKAVKDADTRILIDECEQGMAPAPTPWASTANLERLGIALEFWRPSEAEFQFVTLFDRLAAGSAFGAGLRARDAAGRWVAPHG